MADWVLILMLAFPGGTASSPPVQIKSIYFHDKASCEAARAVVEESLGQIKIRSTCVPTKSEL
jgi:hypothetical protein